MMRATEDGPIYVQPLYDDSDEITEFMAKGHRSPPTIVAILTGEWPHFGPFKESDVRWEWRRAVPESTGNLACRYVDAEPGSRGAFRASIVDALAPLRRCAEDRARSTDTGRGET